MYTYVLCTCINYVSLSLSIYVDDMVWIETYDTTFRWMNMHSDHHFSSYSAVPKVSRVLILSRSLISYATWGESMG